MADQTATAPSWHTETGDRAILLEIRPDVDPEVVPGCALIELAHEDDGPVEMWLGRQQVLGAMTALARIAGCEVREEFRVTDPVGAVTPWITSRHTADGVAGRHASRRVARRFVVTTPAEEVTHRA